MILPHILLQEACLVALEDAPPQGLTQKELGEKAGAIYTKLVTIGRVNPELLEPPMPACRENHDARMKHYKNLLKLDVITKH